MVRINRRTFFRRTVALGAGAALTLYGGGRYRITYAAGPEVYFLRIAHTNDHHARIEPETVTIRSTPAPAITRNFGGVARRKTLIDAIRAEALIATRDLLVLDAGDVFQGTLYFNQYNGLADLDFYRRIGYDAVAIGNHEFDKGAQTLADFITGATTGTYPGQPAFTAGTNFPVLSANITVAAGSPLVGLIQPRITKAFVGSGQTIGIFGLTTEDTAVLSSPGPLVTFTAATAAAQAQVAALQGAGVNKIILLSHLGYTVDLALAAAVSGIDVIVGGHSHTPILPSGFAAPVGINAAGPYPTNVTAPDGNTCVVVTDWEWGKWLGDITIGFDATGAVTSATGTIKPVWADGITGTPPRALLTNEGTDVGADADFKTRIDTVYKPPITVLQNTKIGATAVILNGGSAFRTRESNLGSLIADALLDKTKPAGAQIVITNSGGIRNTINIGDVSVGNVLSVLPFGNTVALVNVKGAQIIAALENGVSQVETTAGRFPQVAGLRFFWNRYGRAAIQGSGSTVAVKGNRVRNVQIKTDTGYVPIDLAATYKVATNNFMLTGGDGYNAFTPGGDLADPTTSGATDQLDTGFVMADVVQDYITKLSASAPIQYTTQGRILTDSVWMPSFAIADATTPASTLVETSAK
ncbi:MAG: 5'-nucleotidase C-terminal domain-containing protein [Roseiflexaceae bacterium]|nr:5'-nucleotidase C-terminal domain-containing protein [Roseiflexaceae bacterium]